MKKILPKANQQNFCRVLAPSLIVASTFIAGAASADETAPKAKRGEITLTPMEITGTLNRPQASFTISRIGVEAFLLELKQELLSRIEASMSKGPF